MNLRNPSGSELSVEDIPYIQTCLLFMIIYMLMLAILAAQIVRAPPDAVRPIHSLFLLTLSAGLLAYLLYYIYLSKLDEEAEVSDSLLKLVQSVDHIFDTLFLASLLLASFGWTIARPALSDREKHFAAISLFSYLFIGLANASCTGLAVSGVSCTTLSVLTYVIKTVIMLGVVVALNFSINQLRTIILHSPWVQSIILQYARSKQLNHLRVAFLAYIILPTVIVLLQLSLLSWKSVWIADFMINLVDVMLAMVVGASFAPLSESYLSRAFDGSLDAGVLRRSH